MIRLRDSVLENIKSHLEDRFEINIHTFNLHSGYTYVSNNFNTNRYMANQYILLSFDELGNVYISLKIEWIDGTTNTNHFDTYKTDCYQ